MRSTRPGSTHPAPSTPSSPGTFLDRAWQGYQLHLFLAWGIFNPNGPTLNCVGLRWRGDDDAPELFHRWLHFTGSGTTVLGQVRPGPEGWDDALRLLQDAFAGPDADALVTAIPTFVVSNLPECWEGLQWELLAATRTVQQADWGRELDLLRRHGRDLFARAGEEAWREVRRLQAQDPDALETRLLAARHASVVDPVGPGAPPLPSAPWDAELYDEWKAVAGDADFSAHALILTAHAWVGAIHLVSQLPTQAPGQGRAQPHAQPDAQPHAQPDAQPHDPAGAPLPGLPLLHPFEALHAFFAACRLPLFGDAEEASPLTSAALARGLGIPTPPEPRGFAQEMLFPLTDVLHYVAQSGGTRHRGVQPGHLILATNGFG